MEVDEANSIRNVKPNQRLRKTRNSDRVSIRIFGANQKAMLWFGIVAFVTVWFLIRHLLKVEEAQKLSVVTPLPAPKLMDLPQVTATGYLIPIIF